jgi:DNA-directed RNA polymerase specialized sigma24 family protein
MTEPSRAGFLESALLCLDALTQLARHLTGQGCDAEDLVQEIYVRGGLAVRDWQSAAEPGLSNPVFLR